MRQNQKRDSQAMVILSAFLDLHDLTQQVIALQSHRPTMVSSKKATVEGSAVKTIESDEVATLEVKTEAV
jgi:hypothetical protein